MLLGVLKTICSGRGEHLTKKVIVSVFAVFEPTTVLVFMI